MNHVGFFGYCFLHMQKASHVMHMVDSDGQRINCIDRSRNYAY
jgi:hypothetical protein